MDADDRIERSKHTDPNAHLPSIDKSGAPGSASKNSLLTLIRVKTGLPLGTVRFKSMESSLELSIKDKTFKIKEDGVISFRLNFNPTFAQESKWWWSENDDEGLKLMDGKKGATNATINSNMLMVEQTMGLTEAAIDEVVLTAVAMAERRRRRKKHDAEGGGIGKILALIGLNVLLMLELLSLLS